MKTKIILLLTILLITGCNKQQNPVSAEELMEVEKMFSDMSVSKGMSVAFNYYCDDQGVLLRSGQMPIVGKDNIAAAMSIVSDDLFSLRWEPTDALIAGSGDMGYTYGVYTIDYSDQNTPDGKGTYVTIWKKNQNGDWKFMLDTGNEGLGSQ